MRPIYVHEYKTVIENKITVKSFNQPEFFSSTSEAKKDIEMALEHFNINDKIKKEQGTYNFHFVIRYEKGENGQYFPSLGDPKVQRFDNSIAKFDHRDLQLTFWSAIKLAFRILFKKDIKREENAKS